MMTLKLWELALAVVLFSLVWYGLNGGLGVDTVKLLATGGTIDKTYNMKTGEMDFSGGCQIQNLLIDARISGTNISISRLMTKDSLDMCAEDRLKIVMGVQGYPGDKILIAHGTDSMHKSAKEISGIDPKKTVIFFGSMIPYSVSNSDALFNFGSALSAVKLLPYGVYVVMNGELIPADYATKDTELSIFVDSRNL
jgi:L-asparaginase